MKSTVRDPRSKKYKDQLVYNISLARQHTTKLMIRIAAILGFKTFHTYVTKAYAQTQIIETLQREVYIELPKEFKLERDQIIKLIKLLDGITESGDY